MIGPWRFFHNPEHIFDVRGDEDAIEVMVALFPDIVYVQVDYFSSKASIPDHPSDTPYIRFLRER